MRLRLLLGVLTGMSAYSLFAQNTYDKAWKSLLDNERDDAIDQFTTVAAGTSSDKNNANLAMAMINDGIRSETVNFPYFQKYLQNELDPYMAASAVWYQQFAFQNRKLRKDQLSLLKKMLVDPKVKGTLKAYVLQTLGNHFKSQNDFKKANLYYGQVGAIRNWSLLGTFENISASGFDKDWPALIDADGSGKIFNKNGVKINWFELNAARVDGWVDLTRNFDFNNDIAFAQTFVNSPKEQWVYLRFGVSGSVKFWVNDQLIFSEFDERNNDLDAYNVKVKLKKGYNRILIQIGQSEIDRANFLVRITDEKYQLIPDITTTAKIQKYPKNGVEFEVIENPVVTYYKQLVEKDSTDYLSYFLLGNAYFYLDRKEENLLLLKKLEERYPNSSFIKMKLVYVYSNLGNRTEMLSTIDWLRQNDKKNPAVIPFIIDELLEKKEYKEAGELLEEYADLAGRTPIYYEKKILVNLNDGGSELGESIITAQSMYPDSYDFTYYKSLLNNGSKSYTANYNMWKKFILKNYDEDYLDEYLNACKEVDKTMEAILFMEKAYANEPDITWLAFFMAQVYNSPSGSSIAKGWIEKAKKNAPYSPRVWSMMADIYQTKGDEEAAKDALKYSIELNPFRYEDRKKLRKLSGQEEDIFKKFPDIDISKLAKNAPSKETFTEGNELIILDETQRVFYKTGGSEIRTYKLIKVFNEAGVDEWKERYEGGEIVKAEVIKSNGSRIAAEIDEDNGHIVFTNLAPGDCIFIMVEAQTYYGGPLRRHAWDDKYFYYKNTSFMKVRYNALVEKGLTLNYTFTTGNIPVKEKEMGAWKMMTWERDSFIAKKSENLMPVTKDVGEVLYLSTIPSWEFINKWYQDLALAKSRSTFETRQAAQEIFAGKDLATLDTLEKAKMIYQYITKNIRYSSVSFRQSGLIPQPAKKVLNTKIGDCKDVSTLFVSLCNEVGIPAELVLIDGRDNGKRDLPLPHIGFDHCIARFKYNNKYYYIELTSDAIPFNSHHEHLVDALYLPITKSDKDSAKIQHLNTDNRLKNVLGVNSTLVIEGNDIKVHKDAYRTGASCLTYRNTYKGLGSAEREKKFRSNMREEYSNLELENLTFRNLDNYNDSVNYSWDFTATDVVTQAGGINILVLPWTHRDKPNDIFTNSKREFPILYWEYASHDVEIETLTIQLPRGKVLTDPPKNVNYSTAFADYSMTYVLRGNVLTITRKMVYKKGVIEVEELKDFREFYKKVLSQDAKTLTYR